MQSSPFATLPSGPFKAILADPPWSFGVWDEARGWNRKPRYSVVSTQAICELPVRDIAAADCVLYLWATYPMIRDALQVIDAWGFTYKTVAHTWVKLNPRGIGYSMGLGYWTRANPEICLLGTRGRPKRLDRGVPNLIVSPRRAHSQKPDEIHERIERLVEGPYVELFARQPWPGWTVWGDEVNQ